MEWVTAVQDIQLLLNFQIESLASLRFNHPFRPTGVPHCQSGLEIHRHCDIAHPQIICIIVVLKVLKGIEAGGFCTGHPSNYYLLLSNPYIASRAVNIAKLSPIFMTIWRPPKMSSFGEARTPGALLCHCARI